MSLNQFVFNKCLLLKKYIKKKVIFYYYIRHNDEKFDKKIYFKFFEK